MMNGNQQIPSYNANTQISITLSLGHWQQVFNLLTEAPGNWKNINPLIVAIDKQIQEALEKTLPLEEQPQRQRGVLPPGTVRE